MGTDLRCQGCVRAAATAALLTAGRACAHNRRRQQPKGGTSSACAVQHALRHTVVFYAPRRPSWTPAPPPPSHPPLLPRARARELPQWRARRGHTPLLRTQGAAGLAGLALALGRSTRPRLPSATHGIGTRRPTQRTARAVAAPARNSSRRNSCHFRVRARKGRGARSPCSARMPLPPATRPRLIGHSRAFSGPAGSGRHCAGAPLAAGAPPALMWISPPAACGAHARARADVPAWARRGWRA